MMKKDIGTKKIAQKTVTELDPKSDPATPDEGARLIRAFLAVKNPQLRKSIVALVENLA